MGSRRPRRAYWRTSVSINSDTNWKSSGLVALRCAFPQLQHDGIMVRHAQYPTASGRVWGWWHWRRPSHNYKMAASQCAITFWQKSGRVQEELNMNTQQRAEEFGVGGTQVCLPTTIQWQHHGAPLYSDRRAEEFKKSSTWSTTLGLRHVYLPVCGRKSQVTSSRHIAVCLLAKDLMKLLYICTCVFFYLWYFRVRVSLRMWQEI